jgi:hypothetical protein
VEVLFSLDERISFSIILSIVERVFSLQRSLLLE